MKDKDATSKIDTNKLLQMISSCHLGGVIDECVLNINEGTGEIQAVDITNSLIFLGKIKKITRNNISGEYGLGDLGLLIKFLGSMREETTTFKPKRRYLEFKRKDGRKKVNYLLTEPDMVSTKLDETDEKKDKKSVEGKLLKDTTVHIDITDSFINSFITNINMLSSKDVLIRYDGDEGVQFICGTENEHQINLLIEDGVEGDEGEEVDLRLNGEHLFSILSIIKATKGNDDPVSIHFEDQRPVVIKSGSITWSLIPLISTYNGDEGE